MNYCCGVRTKNWLLVLAMPCCPHRLIHCAFWLPSSGKRRSFKTPLRTLRVSAVQKTGRLMNPSFKHHTRQPHSTKLWQEPEEELVDPQRICSYPYLWGPHVEMFTFLEQLQWCSVCDPCTSVIGWTKSNVCWFDSGKWFWLSIIAYVAWLLKGAAALCTCRKECNKCDLTAAQCF
jgi:hypothetical protein